MGEHVRIFEVSPRDGLQNESDFIETKDKIRLVNLISAAGFTSVEVTSFVNSLWVPQLADAAQVMQGIDRREGISYSALTPNAKGFENALKANVSEVAVFVAASETFSRKNTNCSIEESFERVHAVMRRAGQEQISVRGYVSCVLDCPYEGRIAPQAVEQVTQKLLDAGCYEVSLGDTIGHGTQQSTAELLDVLLEKIPAASLAGHFHDTQGHAIENIKVSLERGLRTFDSAMAGLGGCPYAPGALGNVDTIDLVKTLSTLGYETGIDPEILDAAAAYARQLKNGV